MLSFTIASCLIIASLYLSIFLYVNYAPDHVYKVIYQYHDGLSTTVCHRYVEAMSVYVAKRIVYRSIRRYSFCKIIEVIRIK